MFDVNVTTVLGSCCSTVQREARQRGSAEGPFREDIVRTLRRSDELSAARPALSSNERAVITCTKKGESRIKARPMPA